MSWLPPAALVDETFSRFCNFKVFYEKTHTSTQYAHKHTLTKPRDTWKSLAEPLSSAQLWYSRPQPIPPTPSNLIALLPCATPRCQRHRHQIPLSGDGEDVWRGRRHFLSMADVRVALQHGDVLRGLLLLGLGQRVRPARVRKQRHFRTKRRAYL